MRTILEPMATDRVKVIDVRDGKTVSLLCTPVGSSDDASALALALSRVEASASEGFVSTPTEPLAPVASSTEPWRSS